jgi:transketolase
MGEVKKQVRMRDAYGEALVRLGERHEDVVALTADVCNSDRSLFFEKRFPERFFNVGIAEQSIVDTAVGFAYSGHVPFVNTFAVFLATRALEMVRTHVCYGQANVKLMGAYAGLSDSFDGPTHHSVTDVAIMRSLPRMSVVVPADPNEMDAVLEAIYTWDGPVFSRLNRNDVPVIFDEGLAPAVKHGKTPAFEIGKARILREGNEVTIIANGIMLSRSLAAAERLAGEGIDARVLEMHTVKPLDYEAVEKAVEDTGAIVTVEEHSIIGGLGGAVAEAVTVSKPVPVIRVGVTDRFAETGPYNKLLNSYGMAEEDIIAAAKKAVEIKGGNYERKS